MSCDKYKMEEKHTKNDQPDYATVLNVSNSEATENVNYLGFAEGNFKAS